MTAMALSVFLAALVGSAHCAAMCGAFACTAADVGPGGAARARAASAYHATRLTGYLLLGLTAGAVGAQIDDSFVLQGISRPAAFVAALLLLGWGTSRLLALAGLRLPRVPGIPTQGWITGVLRRGADRSPIGRAALLGAVSPLLPCGWLWAFVAPAAATGSPVGGVLVMAAFWAGTLPALAALSFGLHRVLGPARRFLPVATAVAMLVVGTVTLVKAVRGDSPAALLQTSGIAGGHVRH